MMKTYCLRESDEPFLRLLLLFNFACENDFDICVRNRKVCFKREKGRKILHGGNEI